MVHISYLSLSTTDKSARVTELLARARAQAAARREAEKTELGSMSYGRSATEGGTVSVLGRVLSSAVQQQRKEIELRFEDDAQRGEDDLEPRVK